jgi:DNA-binding NtrC family response regulator
MRQELQQNIDEAETLCGTRKVLIVDEDIEDLARAAEPFEAHGFEVHKCTTVEAAMRSVEREEFAFALVDQGSPAFEGLRVIRHLVRYNPHTPFVVVTRCKDMLCCQQALTLGAMDYLEKPVPSAEINRIIKNHFGSLLTKCVDASACDERHRR